MMRALLLKNLWTWHPRKEVSVIIVPGLFFAFSLADCVWGFPTEVWLAPLGFTLMLGSGAGQGAMLTDTKDGAMEFLSYLPIRRWQMWLANALDCVATCLVVLAALLWHKLIFWHAPATGPVSDHSNPVELWLFGTRWAPVLAVGSVMFFCAANGMFWQTFLVESKAARFIAGVFINLAALAIPLVLSAFHVVPSPWELATLLIPIGCFLWMAGLICFCWPPAHWSGWRRFAVSGLPCVLAVGLLGAGLLYAACNRWKVLDAGEAERGISYQRCRSPGPGLLVRANSRRSGQHLLFWDKGSESLGYLGRELSAISYNKFALQGLSRDRLCLWASFGSDNLWPCEDRLITIRRDGSDRRKLPITRLVKDGGRELYGVNGLSWTEDGKHCVFTASDSSTTLFVAGADGQIQKRITIKSGRDGDYRLSDSGRLFYVCPESGTHGDDRAPQERRYGVYDIADNRERMTSFRGSLLVLSPDLGHALITRQDADGDEATMLKVSLDDGQESEVIRGEGLGVDVPYNAPSLPGVFPLNGCSAQRNLVVDPTFRHVVISISRTVGKTWLRSFVHIDMQTMRKDMLIEEAPYSGRGVKANGRPMAEDYAPGGFTADGRAFVYGVRDMLVWLELESGTMTRMQLGETASTASLEFSPSGWRVAVEKPEGSRAPGRRKQWVSEVFDRGRLKLSITHGPGPIDWVDEDTLAYHTGDAIEILNVNTGKKTRIDASMLSSRAGKKGSATGR